MTPTRTPTHFITDSTIVGYLPGYRIENVSVTIGQGITDLIFSHAEPTSPYGLEIVGLTNSKLKKLQDIKTKSNGRCKRILLSVGASGGSGAFSTIVGSEANRSAFIRVLAETCQLFNFDGVDFDWEYPFWTWENQGYAQLLMEAKEELSKDNLIVTAAVNIDHLLDASALNTIDRVHLMSYDKPGDHSTYDGAVWDVTGLLNLGVLPAKIYLGVPFYSRDRNLIHDWNFGPEYFSIVANYRNLYGATIPPNQNVYQGKLNGL